MITSPHYCKTIEEAVKHNSAVDDPEAMIERHNARIARKFSEDHPGAGYHLEQTGGGE